MSNEQLGRIKPRTPWSGNCNSNSEKNIKQTISNTSVDRFTNLLVTRRFEVQSDQTQ